jgi:hypothetical protein
MRAHHFVFVAICLFSLISGCTRGGYTSYYGTVDPAKDEAAAKTISDSSATLFKFDVLSFDAKTSPSTLPTQGGAYPAIYLKENVSGLVTWNSPWIHVASDPSGVAMVSPVNGELLFNSLTIVFLVKNTSRGQILALQPMDRFNQAFNLYFGVNQVSATFASSPSDFSSASGPLIKTDENPEDTLVVATFAQDGRAISLSINGSQGFLSESHGLVNPPFVVPRFISVGPMSNGEAVDFKALYLFDRTLSRAEIGVMMRHLIRTYQLNGISPDPIYLPGVPDDSNTGSALPPPVVRAILKTNCGACHSFDSSTVALLKDQGLVLPGDPEGSKLYYRLSGSSGSRGPKTMPQGSSALSGDDQNAIKSWIQALSK